MNINHVNGNIITFAQNGEFDYLVHGCNCQVIMGAGVAKALVDTWPEVLEADRTFPMGRGIWRLGNVSFTTVTTNKGSSLTVVNAYTQLRPSVGADVFEYDSFRVILDKLVHLTKLRWENDNTVTTTFGMPRIGQGLAGGNAPRIMSMIEEFALKIHPYNGKVTVVTFQ